MIELTLAEIATATGGTPHNIPDLNARLTGTSSHDSHAVQPGGLYAAIIGARVDGHDYAPQAAANGALVTLASKPLDGLPAIIVPDVTAALSKLATHALSHLDTQVIAITGSAGKTTAKDLLHQVLAAHGPTTATQGSFNSEIGLPFVILGADPATRYLVLEMGARHRGDLTYLTSLAPPRIGIVLNVGSAHVGEFGGPEEIALAKRELVEALPAEGTAILNADDPRVAAMAAHTPATVLFYGTTDDTAIRADGITVARGSAAFTLHTPTGDARVDPQIPGAHQVHNALAVAATAHTLGMSADAIAAALSAISAISPGRLEILRRPDVITLLNDAFNANPESTRVGLDTLVSLCDGRTVAILGEMRELGGTAAEAHQAVGRYLGALGIDLLVTVGTGHITSLSAAAQSSDPCLEVMSVEHPDDLLDLLPDVLRAGDVVLIKASRSIGLEHLAHRLMHAVTP